MEILEQIENIVKKGEKILEYNPEFREIWMGHLNDVTPDEIELLCNQYNTTPTVRGSKLLFSHCVNGVQLCVWSKNMKINYSYTID